MAYLDDYEKREQEERLRALRLKATDEEKAELEDARSRLSAERTEYLDRCCRDLETRGIYKVKFEIEIAKYIAHDISVHHIKSDVRSIFDNAEWEAAEERIKSEQNERRLSNAQKSDTRSLTEGHPLTPPKAEPNPPAKQPEDIWQQTPGSKRATDASVAMRLGQKERMNNADMDRLESTGPRRSNYRRLEAENMDKCFGEPDPDKVEAREKEAQKLVQTQWKNAARGMTR